MVSASGRAYPHAAAGHSRLALRPKTTEEVAEVLKYCNEQGVPVVPQGGNTGLVGGSVPVNDEVVLSLGGMDKIISLDSTTGTLVCEAGCILQTLQEHVADHGFTMPIDLGAKGSCQIGGNLATAAGGLRFLRYGSLHANVLGMEVVLADGSVLSDLNGLRKDNTGYHMNHLFIGSEGTLGIITKVCLQLPPLPRAVNLAMLAVNNYEDVLALFRGAKTQLAEVLSAIEFQDTASMEMVLHHLHGAKQPFEQSHPFYMIVETSGSNEQHDEEKLQNFLEWGMSEGLVQDGVLAQDSSQMDALWRLREGIGEALSKDGAVYKYDISLPLGQLYEAVEVMRDRLQGTGATVVGFGHLGDGNLHLNITTPEYNPEVYALIEPFLMEHTVQVGGSISAEHGLGLMKGSYMPLCKSGTQIEVMQKLKTLFDPKGILNPYKVLPQ